MKKQTLGVLATVTLSVGSIATIIAQSPPPRRLHRVTTKGTLRPLAATERPPIEGEVTIKIDGGDRIIESNGVPDHPVGRFPNRGNPNRISRQNHRYRIAAEPVVADQITPIHGEFGVAINGVPFDPGAGEFYDGAPGWQYEPLSGAIDLGVDASHAHVQPTGKYHYHGLPTELIKRIGNDEQSHSPLIGWAADGFPIYALRGYVRPDDDTSGVTVLRSSYQLKDGDRSGGDAPAGPHDGTFVADYRYVSGSGDLDQCNGRQCVTPEFPDGTYAYFLTAQWPVIPRHYRGTPSPDFRHGPGGDRDHAGPPRPGQVLPGHLLERLDLTKQQRDQLDELQRDVDRQLETILDAEQFQNLRQPPPTGGPPMQRPPGPRR